MANPSNPLQAALYTRLTGYVALTSLLGGAKVYDHVPQGTDAPYVLIGDNILTEDDTKTSNGWNALITIHCWDFEKAGRKSVNAILGAIYDALHRQESNITVTGFSVVTLAYEDQLTIPEITDGASDHYYHGVMRFRALIKP